jgi:hypothetical protein
MVKLCWILKTSHYFFQITTDIQQVASDGNGSSFNLVGAYFESRAEYWISWTIFLWISPLTAVNAAIVLWNGPTPVLFTPFPTHLLLIILQLYAKVSELLKASLDSGYRSRYSDCLRAGRPRDRSPGRVKNFLFSTSSRPALGSTQPPIKWVPGALSLGVKRPGSWSWQLTSS